MNFDFQMYHLRHETFFSRVEYDLKSDNRFLSTFITLIRQPNIWNIDSITQLSIPFKFNFAKRRNFHDI
jgi:hypothetical protein